jgi:hypothetical protein
LILGNLNNLNQSNLALAKRLIERMSSIVIDDESFECLLKLVETKIFLCKFIVEEEKRKILKIV